MIESVTLDQERFVVPTLRMDSRGLAIGERGVVRFAVLPQVIAFFATLTQEQNLDNLASSMRILKVKAQTVGMEMLVEFPAQSSFLMDRAAQIARLMRGDVYTGKWPHFVPYRDRQSPCGYDAQRLREWSRGPVFYARSGALTFDTQGEVSFNSLMMDLNLERTPTKETERDCVIRARRGLRAPIQSFLIRRNIPAQITQLTAEPHARFDKAETFFLFHVPEMPVRLYHLFDHMPGAEVYHSSGRSLFVERGWRHPFALENCRRFLPDGSIFLFSGTRGAVDVVKGDRLEMVNVQDTQVRRLQTSHESITPSAESFGQPNPTLKGQPIREALNYHVRLVPAPPGASRGAITARLIQDPRELGWLKKIVYSLPKTALERYQIAFTEEGVLIHNPQGVELIPLGVGLKALFPSVFIPAHQRLSPPINEEHFKQALSLDPANLYVFPTSLQRAFSFPKGVLRPLMRYLLADVQTTPTALQNPAAPEVEAARSLKNVPASTFVLWKHNIFKPTLTKQRKALPAPKEPSA